MADFEKTYRDVLDNFKDKELEKERFKNNILNELIKVFDVFTYKDRIKKIEDVKEIGNNTFIITGNRGWYYVTQRKNKFLIKGKDNNFVIKYKTINIKKRINKINSIIGFNSFSDLLNNFKLKKERNFDGNIFLSNLINETNVPVLEYSISYSKDVIVKIKTFDSELDELDKYINEYLKISFKEKIVFETSRI